MALLLRAANAVFLHIPKTGGTWVESVFRELGIDYCSAQHRPGACSRHELREHLISSADFYFTFVRHPISWYESWWSFQAGSWTIWEPHAWHPQRTIECCADDDFSGFIRKCIEHEPAYVTRMYEWYVGPVGAGCVDFVGRFEELQTGLAAVLRQLGYDAPVERLRKIPATNISRRLRGTPNWKAKLHEKIARLEVPAISRFYAQSGRLGSSPHD